MNEQDIYTLQSAVELDRVHNEGKLLRALEDQRISKEEMIASIFSIVQKKNAQNETQKLLSNIAESNNGIIGDYWEKEKTTTIKDRVLNGLIFDKNGNFNMENFKRFGSGLLVVSAIVVGSSAYGYMYLKNKFKNTSKKQSNINREEIEELLQRDEDLERIREQYKKKLESLNMMLENENISDEDREKYEKDKEETEQRLNNNDNSVGGIVEANGF